MPKSKILIFVLIIFISGCSSSKLISTPCDQITDQEVYSFCLESKNPERFDYFYSANTFHGYFDPYVSLGTRMGLYAKQMTGYKQGDIIIYTEFAREPPLGHIIDGLMVSTGATLGKDLIYSIPESQHNSAVFYIGEEAVRLEIKQDILDFLKENLKDEVDLFGVGSSKYMEKAKKLSFEVWKDFRDEDLFIVHPSEKGGFFCYYITMNRDNYFERIREFIKGQKTKEEILDFIDKDPCVRDGFLTYKDGTLDVYAIWKDSNTPVVHSIKTDNPPEGLDAELPTEYTYAEGQCEGT